jgi:hypothetical protein
MHAALADEIIAKSLADIVASSFASCARILRSNVVRYWKIPEHIEIFFELEPVGETVDVFQQVMNTLGTGWHVHRFNNGGDWAVWNFGSQATFVAPEVRWAHLECLCM